MNLIYNLLIGLTDLCKSNLEAVKGTANDNNYYQEIDLTNDLEIKQKLQERSIRVVKEKEFFKSNKNLCIGHFHHANEGKKGLGNSGFGSKFRQASTAKSKDINQLNSNAGKNAYDSQSSIQSIESDIQNIVTVTEYAPNIFRNIRRELVSEQLMFESFIPISNFKGVHDFKTGTGKSPSFFFFSDNKMLMIKTLKQSELKILFETNFMVDYYKYIIANADSLLSRILGVYEMQVNDQSPIFFFVTENMITHDFNAVKRCYDLKGSILDRITKESALE